MDLNEIRFAAIDLGSNAIRLLIANVYCNHASVNIKKNTLFRVPIRLGMDVYSSKNISDKKIKNLILTLKAFKNLMEVYEIGQFRACATAAMRDAENGEYVIEQIKKETDLDVEIISGSIEASIIYENHIAELLDPNKSYLYVDVGGGSTEITLFSGNKKIDSYSFKIGTIRLLKNKVDKERWKTMEKWVKHNVENFKPLELIGSGGNINKIFKLSKKKDGKPLSYRTLSEIHHYLLSFSLEDRVKVLGLRPDRADVIIPASEIFLNIMRWTESKKIHVPKIGLADGIINEMARTCFTIPIAEKL